jgi:hypothetical protein
VVAAAAAGSSIQIYVEDLTKICRQELPRSIPEELAHKHQCKASSRSECKDLLMRILEDFKKIVQDHAKASDSMSLGSPHPRS